MISVIIPVYNEEENIKALLEAIQEELSGRSFEVILVDDSDDSTAEKAREADIGNLNIIHREERSGIGSAVQQGLEEASGGIIVQMDGDFSHRPSDIMKLVEVVESEAEVAVGSRYVEGGERKDSFWRRINPLIGSYLYRFLLGSPVKDVTSGFKAYDREAAEELVRGDFPDGFEFQAASLMHLVETQKKVEEVPIEFDERRAGEPKYSSIDLVRNLLLFSKLFLEKWEKPLKFGTVGASGVLVNMGLLYFLTEVFGVYYLVSAAIAVETSIISNFALNEFWTFIDRGKSGGRKLIERFLKFNSVSVVGMVLDLSILAFLTEVVGIYYLVSNLVAIAVVFLWNYLGNVAWTWPE